jgi:hypothetical protein
VFALGNPNARSDSAPLLVSIPFAHHLDEAFALIKRQRINQLD